MSHEWPEVQTVTVFYIIRISHDKLILNNEHDEYRWIDKMEKELHP